MKIALLGHMGRDDAAAERLAGHELHVLGEWENPGLLNKAEASGGSINVINSIKDTQQIADWVETLQPDMFFTNFDDALAAGVVDAIRDRVNKLRMPEVLIPSPDKDASRVEWDKFYLRELIEEIDPSFNPFYQIAESSREAWDYIQGFEEKAVKVVLKPRNLTGGKGVKVMGKHFETYSKARYFAHQILADENQSGVEIQEKIEGHEFTLQILSDGKTMIEPPPTYDYPYREDGDTGPGTGGMGSFSMPEGERLPFLAEGDLEKVMDLMEKLLVMLKDKGHDFKGVLYPTFFKTREGQLKIVEVNARGGDPELINVLDLMEDDIDYAEVLKQIATGDLQPNSVRYKKAASTLIYLVSPEYGYKKRQAYDFSLDKNKVKELGCKIRFAAARKIGPGHYRTVGSSRTVGLSALGNTPWIARHQIQWAIRNGFKQPIELDYRREIANETYIKDLAF